MDDVWRPYCPICTHVPYRFARFAQKSAAIRDRGDVFRTRAHPGEALHMDKNSDYRVGYRSRRGRRGLSLIDGYHLA